MRTIIVLLYLLLYFLFSIPVLAVDFFVRKANPRLSDICQLRLVQWGFGCVSFLSGIRMTVIGQNNIPTDRPVLFCGNHRSFFDIVVTYPRCPGPTGYIAKDGVDKVPVLRIIMRRLHCLFLDRKDLKQGLKTILTAIDLVKSGISICVFPEGTRNKDQENPQSLLPFREGAFKISQKTDCPIVPMALIGTDNVLENHFPWIRSTNVTLVYGQPFCPSELDTADQKHLGAYCQKVIAAMLAEYTAGE